MAVSSQMKDSMWKEYFTNPFVWWDNRTTKKNPMAPDFKHKVTKQTLWLDDPENPPWVSLKLGLELEKQKTDEFLNVNSLAGNPGLLFNQSAKVGTENANMSTASFFVQANMEKPKTLDNFDWKALSLEQAVLLLEEQASPPPIDILANILHKCRRKRSLVYANRINNYLTKNNLKFHRRLGNYLVPMLVDCGCLQDAQNVFVGLRERNEFSWSSLIHGYCECGDFKRAFSLYKDMREQDVHPSPYTFLSLLKSCIRLDDIERGQEMHNLIIIFGYEHEGSIGNILVDMYSRSGAHADAQAVLFGLSTRDVVAWTTLIAGYADCGLAEKVWECLGWMHSDGVASDAAAHICSLKAFSNAGAIDYGRDVHSQVIMGGFEEDNLVVNVLVDMYAKCGFLEEAWNVFNKVPMQGVVSWTALISGHARIGECEVAFELFEEMIGTGVHPNDATFLIVLSMCSHAGMVEKGLSYFQLMENEYGITPTLDHYNCMLDLLGRSGQLNAAMLMLENMPVTPNLISWKTVLSGCRKWGNVGAAKQVYELAMRKYTNHSSVLALMCNIFGDLNIMRDFKMSNKVQMDIEVKE
ncbi:hypothetical protein KP509_10G062000 [Ceratopteris richardii]|uniref:Pentatricopeptide repeat-containing protein n=1 Tax=Ceratopteris richardii TaxID=49495 RepID=A0A8T2TWG2_CERRI|nr:hypothetical protein KP509_10G062000 [Ceratopteris richardii]